MTDIGKGDWVECIDASVHRGSHWAVHGGRPSVTQGNTYYVEEVGRSFPCAVCDKDCYRLKLLNVGGILCPSRFRPLRKPPSPSLTLVEWTKRRIKEPS